MLHNARAEYREEAEEIATYTVIDALATSVGDTQTAKLARDIRSEEERMATFIADLLPQLATDVAHDEIPVSEIKGPAKRRTTTGSGRTRRASPKSKQSTPSSKKAPGRSKSQAQLGGAEQDLGDTAYRADQGRQWPGPVRVRQPPALVADWTTGVSRLPVCFAPMNDSQLDDNTYRRET